MRDKIQNDQFTTNFQQGDEFFAGDAWDAGRFCTSDRSHRFDFTNLLPIFRILWTLLHLLKTHHPDETARTPHGPCQRCQVGHATPALATRAASQQRAPSLLAVYQSLYRGAVVSWDLVLD